MSLLSISLSPNSEDDRRRLMDALAILTAEDPSLVVRSVDEAGVVVAAIGERQIEILIERLKREYDVHASVGVPSVVYKTTLDEDGIPILLEPFVLVEVTAPADYVEEVAENLTSRRAEILSVEASRGGLPDAPVRQPRHPSPPGTSATSATFDD